MRPTWATGRSARSPWLSGRKTGSSFRQALLARRAAAPEIGEVAGLSGADAQRLFPPLRAGAAAVYIGGAARVDGRKLAAALARAAARHGTVVRDGEAHLALGAGRVAGVRVGGELIEGDAVIAATGAWTRSFLQAAGLEVPVGAQRGQIMHIRLDAAAPAGGRWCCPAPAATTCWPSTAAGSWPARPARPAPAWTTGLPQPAWPRSSARPWPSPPAWPGGTYLETRVGFRPVGPGIRPLLGPVPGLDGLVVATGLGASGLTMGPLAGSLAAQAALGLPRAIDLEPFAPLPEPPGSR